MADSLPLTGKRIWITGSGRGIGRAAALKLAAKGAAVIVSARTEKEINAVADAIRKSGGQALAVRCDVSDKEQVHALVHKVREQLGSVDVLINNAGIGIFKKVTELAEDEWNAMMDTNLKAAFLCAQAVLPDMMEKNSGHIINVISVAGKQPYYNCSGYCASKYGLLGFTDVLRLEVRKYGIHVTAFLPGATDTAIWGDANVDRSRMMTPEQVADNLVNICCTDRNSMVEEIVLRPVGGDL